MRTCHKEPHAVGMQVSFLWHRWAMVWGLTGVPNPLVVQASFIYIDCLYLAHAVLSTSLHSNLLKSRFRAEYG